MTHAQVQVTPVPVFEYRLYDLVHQDQDKLQVMGAELSVFGAEGWGVAGVVFNGNAVLFARQVAVRLVPVEEPTVLGVSGQLRLAHPGNGR